MRKFFLGIFFGALLFFTSAFGQEINRITEDLILRVDVALFRGDPEQALKLWRQIEKSEKAHLEVLLSYVRVLKAQGKADEASELLARLLQKLKTKAGSDLVQFELASIKLAAERFEEAEKGFSAIPRDSRVYLSAQVFRALVWYRLGMRAKAEKLLSDVEKSQGPHLEILRIVQGQIAMENGNIPLAQVKFIQSEGSLRALLGAGRSLPNSIFRNRDEGSAYVDFSFGVQKIGGSESTQPFLPLGLGLKRNLSCNPLGGACRSLALDSNINFALNEGSLKFARHKVSFSDDRLAENAGSKSWSLAYVLSTLALKNPQFLYQNSEHRLEAYWATREPFNQSPFVFFASRLGFGLGLDDNGGDFSVEYLFTKTRAQGLINPVVYGLFKARGDHASYGLAQIQYINPIRVSDRVSFVPSIGYAATYFLKGTGLINAVSLAANIDFRWSTGAKIYLSSTIAPPSNSFNFARSNSIVLLGIEANF